MVSDARIGATYQHHLLHNTTQQKTAQQVSHGIKIASKQRFDTRHIIQTTLCCTSQQSGTSQTNSTDTNLYIFRLTVRCDEMQSSPALGVLIVNCVDGAHMQQSMHHIPMTPVRTIRHTTTGTMIGMLIIARG
jgi:hypothetical protein